MRMRVGGGVLSAVLTYTHIHTHTPPAHGKKAAFDAPNYTRDRFAFSNNWLARTVSPFVSIRGATEQKERNREEYSTAYGQYWPS